MAQNESSSSSLMMGNYTLIFVYTAAHLMLAYFVIFQAVADEGVLKHLGAVLAGGAVGTVFTILVTELPGAIPKARLVYFRWKNPLPGFRAFSEHLQTDSGHRINVTALRAKYTSLPSDEAEQNTLWYKFLQQHSSNGAVLHTHRLFLLFRDLTWISSVLLLVTAIVGWTVGSPAPPVHVLVGIFLAEFLIVRRLAARAGIDLVQTVLAVESGTP